MRDARGEDYNKAFKGVGGLVRFPKNLGQRNLLWVIWHDQSPNNLLEQTSREREREVGSTVNGRQSGQEAYLEWQQRWGYGA